MAAFGSDGQHQPRVTIGFETYRRITRRRASSDLVAAVHHGNAEFAALPGATREADVFTQWRRRAHGTTVHAIDPEAPSRSALLERLPQSQFAHIVSHGIFRPDRPDESGLMLIAADGSSELVSLRDLSNLDLSVLDLLTLSSCWGADSFVLPGRFVLSLPEMCWRAGARRVIASLWEVDDEVGAALIQRFYHYLESHAPDEALARTREDCSRNELLPPGSRDTSYPFYWAGLQVYGD
jgi:CHAT domain-containing protein